MKKRRCIFACNPDSGEPGLYCGHTDDMDDLRRGLAAVVVGELDQLFTGGNLGLDNISLDFDVKRLTDDEIAALPDC